MNHRQMWWVASNAAYPMAGLWLGEPVTALVLLVVGAASAYYHAGGDHGNHIDVAAVYGVLFYLIGLHWGVPPIYLPVPAFVAGLLLRMKTLDVPMEVKVAALAAPLLFVGLLTGASLLLGAAVLVVALVARQWVDHGLWHVLSAGGLALVAHSLLSSGGS